MSYLEKLNKDIWELTWEVTLPQFFGGLMCGNGTNRVCHGSEVPIFFRSGGYDNTTDGVLESVNFWQRARDAIDLYRQLHPR